MLSMFELGQVHAITPVAHGSENANYFISSDRGQYVLTRVDQPSFGGDAMAGILASCERAGLPVPAIMTTITGSLTASWDGKPALLCRRLHGDHVHAPTLDQNRAIGRFLARMHRATQPLEDVPPHPRNLDWLRQSSEGLTGQRPFSERELLCRSVTVVASLLERPDVRRLPRGAIHADLFRDNALFNAQGLTGVLDFHHASAGALVFDVAVAINDWCSRPDGSLAPEHVYALLRTYHRERALTTAELWLLPVFLSYAAATFWVARLLSQQAETSPESTTAKRKDPNEFKRILQDRLSRPLTIDERLLG